MVMRHARRRTDVRETCKTCGQPLRCALVLCDGKPLKSVCEVRCDTCGRRWVRSFDERDRWLVESAEAAGS